MPSQGNPEAWLAFPWKQMLTLIKKHHKNVCIINNNIMFITSKEDKEIKKMKYNKYKYDITCIL